MHAIHSFARAASRHPLGVRITAVERIRAGSATVETTAAGLGVQPAVVRSWLERLRSDRTFHLDEFRRPDPESSRLARHAQQLRKLIARTERSLHVLHAQLLASRTKT